MARAGPRCNETLVALDAAWLRAETADAVRTFLAPFKAVAHAIERVSRPASVRGEVAGATGVHLGG